MRGSLFVAVAAILARGAFAQQISTIAGNGQQGYSGDGGPALEAALDGLTALAVDADGNVYLEDKDHFRVRRISADGTIATVAGTGQMGTPPAYVNTEGQPATAVGLIVVHELATDAAGSLYIADQYALRKVDRNGAMTTVVGLGPSIADGSAATKTGTVMLTGVAVDGAGNIYYSEYTTNLVRKVDTAGIVRTVAGRFGIAGFDGDGGPATQATLNSPTLLAADRDGNLYIFDSGNRRIRRVALDGTIATLIGAGGTGYSGDDGPAAAAQFREVQAMACDTAGNFYFTDTGNARVRRVGLDGAITTVAGNGIAGTSGDGGPATAASVFPQGLAVDASGNLYVGGERRIRKVSAAAASPDPGPEQAL